MNRHKIGWLPALGAAVALGTAALPLNAQTNPHGEQILMGNNRRESISVSGKSFLVRGNNNVITWTGYTPLLRVSGNGNRVYGQAARVIVISGRNNSVYWSKRYNGRSPRVSRTGSGNGVNFDKNASPKR